MVDKYSDPEVYIGGKSTDYIDPEDGGRVGARDRRRVMHDTGQKRYIGLSGGSKVSDVMGLWHPFLFRKYMNHVNKKGGSDYDIPPLEGVALDKAKAICETFRQDWIENTTQVAQSGVAAQGVVPTPVKIAITEGSAKERMAACKRLWDELDKNQKSLRKYKDDLDVYKKRAVKYEREVVELRQRAESAPPKPKKGKLYLDNQTGEELICIPIQQVNAFLEKTDQGWEIQPKKKPKRTVRMAATSGSEAPTAQKEPAEPPTQGEEATSMEVDTEEWPQEWPKTSTEGDEDMTITMKGGRITSVTTGRATLAGNSSTSSESKKRRRSEAEPEELTEWGTPKSQMKTHSTGGPPEELSSTSSSERERVYVKMTTNKQQGKFPWAGLKKGKKRASLGKPSAKDLNDPAHRIGTTPGYLPTKISVPDPVMESPPTALDEFTAPDGQLAALASEDQRVECPEVLAGRVHHPVNGTEKPKLESHCKVPYCAARNNWYSIEEFDDPTQEQFVGLNRDQVQEMADLENGPFNLKNPNYAPKAVLNYGLGGAMEWEECMRALKSESFFTSIESRAMFSFDVEGYPQRDQKYTADAVNNQVALLHLMSPNGVMLQLSVCHDGTEKGDPNEREVPADIKQLFKREDVLKFGMGAAEDAERLMRSGVVPEIRSVCEIHNLVLLAYPQFQTELKDLQIGKKFLGQQLDAPVRYTDKWLPGVARQVVTGFKNLAWDFTASFENYSNEMIRYNRNDHCLSYALLCRCALRFAEVEKFNGELLRVILYLLCYIRGWKTRTRAADLSERKVRPFRDWFGGTIGGGEPSGEELRGANAQPLKAGPFYPHPRLFNTLEETFAMLRQLTHTWGSDGSGMNPNRFNAVQAQIEKIAPQGNVGAIVKAYYSSPHAGPHIPHVCAICGSSHHRTKFCHVMERDLGCIYCNAPDHVVKVCNVLHRRCTACGLRGHAEINHQVNAIYLWNNFLKGRWLGFLTVRRVMGPVGYRPVVAESTGYTRMVAAIEDEKT